MANSSQKRRNAKKSSDAHGTASRTMLQLTIDVGGFSLGHSLQMILGMSLECMPLRHMDCITL
eukprot:2981911-Ditylum_brightwellii.AAC.1